MLLLGNGLCRAYGGMSWDQLLDEIKDQNAFPHPACEYVMPMPLKAAMLANNTLSKQLRKIVAEDSGGRTQQQQTSWQNFVHTTEEMRTQICKLVDCGFDYILTTNYSYQIEAALMGANTLSPYKVAQLMNFYEIGNAQTQFLINTFNLAKDVPVFHIHGEARKPDSMVLGHYYYGKLLRRCVARLDGTEIVTEEGHTTCTGKEKEFKRNIKTKHPQKIGSWIDAFVLGDVYILGFGMDFSEADLWWLVEYKSNHPDLCGRTTFFEPKKDNSAVCVFDQSSACSKSQGYVPAEQCKHLLLKETYHVDIKSLGVTIQNSSDYQEFYSKAIAVIAQGKEFC